MKMSVRLWHVFRRVEKGGEGAGFGKCEKSSTGNAQGQMELRKGLLWSNGERRGGGKGSVAKFTPLPI